MIDVDGAPEDVGMSAARLRNGTRLVRDYVAQQRYPNVITVIARRDKVVHLDVCGAVDVERARPMRPDSIFRVYSMTKPIASVALMALYEEGRCQLDDPVSRFIPAWRGLKVLDGGDLHLPVREMTVRDLLTHMSGLVSPSDRGPVGQLYRDAGIRGHDTMTGTLADVVAKLAGVPLCADPGARWIYGISTDRFTACYAPPDGGSGHRLIDDPATSVFARPRRYLSGVAELVSTAGDYLRFCRMLARGGELDGARILGPRTLAYMTANHLPRRPRPDRVRVDRQRDEPQGARLRARIRQVARPGRRRADGVAGRVLLGRRGVHRVLRQPGRRSRRTVITKGGCRAAAIRTAAQTRFPDDRVVRRDRSAPRSRVHTGRHRIG